MILSHFYIFYYHYYYIKTFSNVLYQLVNINNQNEKYKKYSLPIFSFDFLTYSILILFAALVFLKYKNQKFGLILASLGAAFVLLFFGKAIFVPGIETEKSGFHNFSRLEINVPQE